MAVRFKQPAEKGGLEGDFLCRFPLVTRTFSQVFSP